MTVIRSSNSNPERDKGSVEPMAGELDLTRYVRAPRTVETWDFLKGYSASFERKNADTGARIDDPTFRMAGGEEADADAVMAGFVRAFVLRDFSPKQQRTLWGLARNRKLQLGLPVVLATSESESMYDPRALHVFFAGVPASMRGLFATIGAEKALKPAEVEVVALVLMPDPEHIWVGEDGRSRLSMYEEVSSDLLGVVAPLRQWQAEAWYGLLRGAVRHLWTQANPRPVRGPRPLDDLDAADLASLLGSGEYPDSEPF